MGELGCAGKARQGKGKADPHQDHQRVQLQGGAVLQCLRRCSAEHEVMLGTVCFSWSLEMSDCLGGLILLQGEPRNCFGAASPCACPALEGCPGRGHQQGDRTVARCSCGVAQPAQPRRGQHLGLLPPPVRGAGTPQGAVPGGLQQCQKIPAATPPSLPLPWVTLLCSSPSAPGRSHPLQPLPSPSSRASHNTEFLFTQGKSVIYFPACFTSISSWITACRINPAPST